jgi:hypothetical protein
LLAETLPSNQLEHSRVSGKRSTAGAPRCSTGGAAKKEREAQQGLQDAAQQWLRKVLNLRRMKYKNRINRG